jgi:hypothetical protein
MPQQEFVTDILQPTDPELAELVSVRQVAAYWKAKEEFARKILQKHGVHLVRVDYPLMVRWRDIEEFENAHTIFFANKNPEGKEVAGTS